MTSRCIDNLNEPLFNYETVLRAISLSLDRGDKEREMVSRFFAEAHGQELSSFAFEKGFEMCFERISDLQLDCPNVKEVSFIHHNTLAGSRPHEMKPRIFPTIQNLLFF